MIELIRKIIIRKIIINKKRFHSVKYDSAYIPKYVSDKDKDVEMARNNAKLSGGPRIRIKVEWGTIRKFFIHPFSGSKGWVYFCCFRTLKFDPHPKNYKNRYILKYISLNCQNKKNIISGPLLF